MRKFLQIAAPGFLGLAAAVCAGPAARAATTAPNSQTISQAPAAYSQQSIAPNLFFLLDDSGSMTFEYLGSKSASNATFPYGYPMGTAEPYGGATYCYNDYSSCTPNIVPGFDQDNLYAAQYRAAYVNPNYYNPAVTYTPWACSASYPENASQTNWSSPINGFSCHWDATIGLWVMDNADPAQAYVNPAKASQGYRDVEVWNDSSGSQQKNTDNGFAGDSNTRWYLASGTTSGNACYNANSNTNSKQCTGVQPFWPATYYNYFGPMPGTSSDYQNVSNYQYVQICPAVATLNSNGVSSLTTCTPPPALPASISASNYYHTYTAATGTYTDPQGVSITCPCYVYVKGDGSLVARTYAQEMQNFANWFQYYRSHILMSDAGIGIAFMQLPNGFRVDFGVLSQASQNNFTGQTGIQSKTDFDLTNRSGFLQKLYNQNIPPQGTPSRLALYYVGEWFASKPTGDPPWGGDDLSCRPNYTVFMTDGQWNGPSPTSGNVKVGTGVGNEDGTAAPSPITNSSGASYQYQPAPPYSDSVSTTLADVAMKFWKNDIQTGMENDVPVNSQDGAFWQHMDTFTVGLGVTPSLVQTYMLNNPGVSEQAAQQAVYQELANGTAQWPDPFNNNAYKIDDLWHAAIDGHGTFASAKNPTALYKALSDALVNIVNRTASSSSLSISSEKAGEARTTLQVYQAIYHPHNWWGDLLDLPLSFTSAPNSSTVSASVSGNANWSASCVLTGGACPQMGTTASGQALYSVTGMNPSARDILTWNGSSGVDFSTSTLTPAEVSSIGGAAIVDYIRGDRTDEQANGGTLRTRNSVMGDVVRSSPQFVTPPQADYPDSWTNLLYPGQTQNENTGQKYSSFESSESTRKSVVYAGADDGMLHAFYAPPDGTAPGAGTELMAYVPKTVWPNLDQYAQPNYAHRYYVNATPGIGDLFYGGQWHTWLVSGEGGGGNSVFALNVTDPSNFGNTNTVVGEWGPSNICSNPGTVCNSQDLGDTFGTPVITKFNNDEWGFVFGNGFNSPSGAAAIYIGLVGSTGNVTMYELPTGYGPGYDPTGQNRPDGIAYVTAVDLNGDHTVDYVYAGDYFGNVWRFNLTSSNPANWSVSTYGGAGGTPLFSAGYTNSTNKYDFQPITTKLVVAAVPSASGLPRVLVEFGTGSEVYANEQLADTTSTGVQSLYGIWDWNFTNWNTKSAPAFQYAALPNLQQPASPLSRDGASSGSYSFTQQSITNEVSTTTIQGGTNYNRVTTSNVVCWDGTSACTSGNNSFGWYMDLVSPVSGMQGEKVIYNPIIKDGVFIVNTTIPSGTTGTQACGTVANTGWTMALDPENGGRLAFEPFDTTGNGDFDQVVTGSGSVNSSGIALGAVGTPSFVSYGTQTFMVTNTSGGHAQVSRINLNSGKLRFQITWQELR